MHLDCQPAHGLEVFGPMFYQRDLRFGRHAKQLHLFGGGSELQPLAVEPIEAAAFRLLTQFPNPTIVFVFGSQIDSPLTVDCVQVALFDVGFENGSSAKSLILAPTNQKPGSVTFNDSNGNRYQVNGVGSESLKLMFQWATWEETLAQQTT